MPNLRPWTWILLPISLRLTQHNTPRARYGDKVEHELSCDLSRISVSKGTLTFRVTFITSNGFITWWIRRPWSDLASDATSGHGCLKVPLLTACIWRPAKNLYNHGRHTGHISLVSLHQADPTKTLHVWSVFAGHVWSESISPLLASPSFY